MLLEWIQCVQAVVSLRMVTPGAEFRGVTLHRLYFKECIAGNVYQYIVGRKSRRVARNSQWGAVLGPWGRSPQPLEANGGLGTKPPALKNFAFF